MHKTMHKMKFAEEKMEIQDELLTSYAWKQLTNTAKLVYLYCSLQHDLSRHIIVDTPLAKLIKETNLRLFDMSYDIMKRYMPSITKDDYDNAIHNLLLYRFIKHNSYTMSENVYMLVDGWKSV